MKLKGGKEMRENDRPIDRTVIKIRTKENMYYTFMELPWEQLENDENRKTFKNVKAYARFLANNKIQDIVCGKEELLYLYPENKAISRDSIKEIYIEDTIALKPEN